MSPGQAMVQSSYWLGRLAIGTLGLDVMDPVPEVAVEEEKVTCGQLRGQAAAQAVARSDSTSRILVTATIARTVEAFLQEMIGDLQASGAEVLIAADCGGTSAECARTLSETGAKVIHLPWKRTPLAPTNALALWQLRRLIRAENIDLVEAHTPIAAAISRIAVRSLPAASRPKMVYFAHGFHFQDENPRGTARVWLAIERLLSRWTDSLFVINKADHALAIASLSIGSDSIVRLQGVGIDLDYYEGDQVEPQGESLKPVVVIGALNPGKRPIEAVEAVAGLDTSRRLVFAGDGPLHDDIVKRARELGVQVEMLGRVPDVRQLLSEAGALLFLSEREGLPRSVLEAVAMGVPVVSHPIRGVVDILEGHPWWHQPESRDAKTVAAALDRALTSQHGQIQMRESIRSFDSTSVARAHTEILLNELRP